MFKKSLAVFAIVFVLSGCGDDSPKIDASSEAGFYQSIIEISATLNDEDRARLQIIAMASLSYANGDLKLLQEAVHGKTVKQVFKQFEPR